MASKKEDGLLCPVCQEGFLKEVERGKVLKIFSDIWLICDKCNAEFDKKLDKAILIKTTSDPFGVYDKYAMQTFTIEKWTEIAFDRMRLEDQNFHNELSSLSEKMANYVLDQFYLGKIHLKLVDLSGFILKKNEEALFATNGEIIEEKKRRITQRTTTGGGRRNYGGFSFRIAKGIYYHTGSSYSASPRQTVVKTTEYSELVSVDEGEFLITNNRLMFKGNRCRGIAVPIKKIAAIDIDPDNNALLIIQENKKPVIVKLLTSMTMKICDMEVNLSVDLDNLVDFVRNLSQTNQ